MNGSASKRGKTDKTSETFRYLKKIILFSTVLAKLSRSGRINLQYTNSYCQHKRLFHIQMKIDVQIK